MWAPLVKQAVIRAAAHRLLHHITCNIPHQRFTSLNPSTPTQTHGNVLSPALGTSTFALHTALPFAAVIKEDPGSKYTSFNLKFSAVYNFSLRFSSCNWKKKPFYVKIAFTHCLGIVSMVWCWDHDWVEIFGAVYFVYFLLTWNTTNWKFLAIESMYINHDLVMMQIGRWTLGRISCTNVNHHHVLFWMKRWQQQALF